MGHLYYGGLYFQLIASVSPRAQNHALYIPVFIVYLLHYVCVALSILYNIQVLFQRE